MVLIQTEKLSNSLEARKREREHMEELKPTLNILSAYRSEQDLKQYKQRWARENEEHVKEYKQNWNMENKDRISECRKEQYRTDKRDEVLARSKKYYHDNIEERRQTRNRLCSCICGDTYTYANKKRHERTKKHQEYLNNQANEEYTEEFLQTTQDS